MVRKFLTNILVSALAVSIADKVLAGFDVYGGLVSYLIAGGVLTLLNTFVRPLLKLITLPLIALSFGLFTFLLNAGILWIVSRVLDHVVISGVVSLAWATLIISAITTVVHTRSNH